MVYKLSKALYGLKQAPRAWYCKIDDYFGSLGFQRSSCEPTGYRRGDEIKGLLLLCLYVDDILYMGSSTQMMEEFRDNMMVKFEMTDLGPLRYFLGLEIQQQEGCIHVSRVILSKSCLLRGGIFERKSAPTPLNTNEKLQLDDGSGKADETIFRSMIGGLIYLGHTRPDLGFAVSLLSRYMNAPTKTHMGVMKRILRYISGTIELGIQYTHVSEFGLVGFVDSDWGACIDDRRSTTGWVFSLGSGSIAWASKKQDSTALSSTEAE
ncbi:uncharacterized mitochondrial protein AtMg00810-like [Dioscorea cayenensis subsp. rotundata]|uniref:Uncharacterized mitochondrial protein AtMg00810-like n=1 Tax=Dioscorea cayennensis subsp. rotundata TaxID=55577 RepID=A0AB40C9B5_DIOCR|nr:uncharacterized mitochondrial protein AtMg00810-like [Dioscorea cayenensis subsp. rotundata]